MNTDIKIKQQRINYLELPLATPDPPEQEDDGQGEDQTKADKAQRHDRVAADSTILKYIGKSQMRSLFNQ